MKIEDNRKEKTKRFEDIKIGECFEEKNKIYIKTDISNCSRNAFSFASNEMKSFEAFMRVTPITAKVVIEV